MLSLLLVIACLPQFITSSTLNLIFNTANSTCSAACSTCSDTSNTNTTTSNSNTALLEELLNTTSNNDQDIKAINQKIDGLMSTTTTNAGAINDILLLVEDLLALHNRVLPLFLLFLPLVKRLRISNQTVLLVCIYWQLLIMELNMFTVIWRSCVVQEEDGQD